ncbi:CPBP family intramembrane glutamic endopeptidase [Lysinibacillus sp. FSL M8-0134]|uniref:CPBP family intramembrane glutamic endopeptidase n=1 Tax=Lysinibacillus sp. FSL M8-0134 TaxID=2921717 RepID=UPI0031198AE4
MNKKQWLIFIAIMLFLTFTLFIQNSIYTLLLLIFMLLQYVVNLNAKRIKNNSFKNADWVRRTLYFIPYLSAVLFLLPNEKDIFPSINIVLSIVLSVIAGFFFIYLRKEEIKPFYNKELIIFFPPVTKKQKWIESYSLIFSAIFQELFYKLFVLTILIPIYGSILSILISAFLFVSDHIIHDKAQAFRTIDHILQFSLSVLGGCLYILSGNVVTAVIIHLIYNLSISISYFYRYKFSNA